MPRCLLLLFASVLVACSPAEPPAPADSTAPPAAAAEAGKAAPSSSLRIAGTQFQAADGKDFEWRGISAFRLVEMTAHGREGEAVRFLDWASSRRLTVIRVFLMAHHLFKLAPDEGRKALPRLLTLASERGLYVEIVALADTAEITLDIEGHVKGVAAAVGSHRNAVVEIANEPWHPTQDTRLHDPAYVKRLADLVPASIPVALGSAETDAGYAAGRYATWHSPRHSGDGGWQHVLALAEGAKLTSGWGKPVISDEPIGAAPAAVPGRRDNEPARFAAAASLTRLAGLGVTFHYEGGLQAQIPSGRELECFDAWVSGLDLLRGLPAGGRFLVGGELAKIAEIDGVRAAFGRTFGNHTWIVAIDPGKGASVRPRSGAKLQPAGETSGVRVYRIQ